MNPEQFCYWLQGYMELADGHNELNCIQVQKIKEHLATVFTKITPVHPTHAPTYCAEQKQIPLLVDEVDKITPNYETEKGIDTVQTEEALNNYFDAHNKRLCELNPNAFTLGPATFKPKPWPTT